MTTFEVKAIAIPTAEELRTQQLTPEIEARARQIREKPHFTEELVCALLNEVDKLRGERDDAVDDASAMREALLGSDVDGARAFAERTRNKRHLRERALDAEAHIAVLTARIQGLLEDNTRYHNRHIEDLNALDKEQRRAQAVLEHLVELEEEHSKLRAQNAPKDSVTSFTVSPRHVVELSVGRKPIFVTSGDRLAPLRDFVASMETGSE